MNKQKVISMLKQYVTQLESDKSCAKQICTKARSILAETAPDVLGRIAMDTSNSAHLRTEAMSLLMDIGWAQSRTAAKT